eukprot:1321707-Amorphochlora_amoeboformis.AAC.1
MNLQPKLKRATTSQQATFNDPQLIMAQTSHSSSNLPHLPEEASKLKLIDFGTQTPKLVMSRVRQEFAKLKASVTSRKKYEIEGEVVHDGEYFQFSAGLYSLQKRQSVLEMRLHKGERLDWWSFIQKFATAVGGKTSPQLQEFITNYSTLPDLDGAPVGQPMVYDKQFAENCAAMVKSGYAENQIMGLKGLKEVSEYCVEGDQLATESAEPITGALKSASTSENITVVRQSSELLLNASKLYSAEAKNRAKVFDALKGMRELVATPKQRQCVEAQSIKENIKKTVQVLEEEETVSGLVAVEANVV